MTILVGPREKQVMARLRRLLTRIDRRCAHLNAGLTAVAVVLAGVVVVIAVTRLQQYADPPANQPDAGMVGNE